MPAFNLSALKDEGYDYSYKLWHGNIPYTLDRNSLRMMSANLWGGKNNVSQNMIMEKVVTAFNSTNWIKEGWLNYERDGGRLVGSNKWLELQLLGIRVNFPLGKCLQLVIPQEIMASKIITLGIVLDNEVMDSLGVENVNIYFRDPNANFQFILPPFKIKDIIFKPGQRMWYDLKSRVNVQLAEDPKNACHNYERFGEYEKCKNGEMEDIFQSMIGCVPFWFTDQPEHCGEKITTEQNLDIVYDLTANVLAGSFRRKCLSPCTTVEYLVEHKSTEVIPDGVQDIYIDIDQNVQIARTSFVIDPFTLLIRLGGTIGICKEALWCILILVGTVMSANKVFRTWFHHRNIGLDEESN